jgi:Response regulator containing a CheY-like receiver domain and an HD-GYP domain
MKFDKTLFDKKYSLADIGLYNKNALAVFFMFVIPMLLACYLVFILPRFITGKEALLSYTRIIVILMSICGLVGYLILRKVFKTLISIIKQAENLSAGKKGKKIDVVWNDELKGLAQSFNKINTDLETKVKELEYSQRLTRELFQQIGHAITGSQKMGALFNIIVHGARKVMETSSSFIALYDNDGALHLKAYSGVQNGLQDNMKLPDDTGVIGQVIKNSYPMVVNQKDTALIGRIGKDVISYETGIVCVPIIVKDRIKGVLGATDKVGVQNVSPEDISLLENIASQVAVCVENLELSKNIEETYYNTLVVLARIVEAKDTCSAGHLERVSAYVRMMADKLGLDKETTKILVGGALLHDLGKVGIEDAILKKEGQLNPQEYEMMKQHSIIGENILKPLQSMSKLSVLVRHHHELYDGTGYPDGLKGEDIPMAARILTVIDIYDALTADRSYRKALSHEEGIKMLRQYSGSKLDPKLVEIFVRLIAEKDNLKI